VEVVGSGKACLRLIFGETGWSIFSGKGLLTFSEKDQETLRVSRWMGLILMLVLVKGSIEIEVHSKAVRTCAKQLEYRLESSTPFRSKSSGPSWNPDRVQRVSRVR
jgi:hypothetical protein